MTQSQDNVHFLHSKDGRVGSAGENFSREYRKRRAGRIQKLMEKWPRVADEEQRILAKNLLQIFENMEQTEGVSKADICRKVFPGTPKTDSSKRLRNYCLRSGLTKDDEDTLVDNLKLIQSPKKYLRFVKAIASETSLALENLVLELTKNSQFDRGVAPAVTAEGDDQFQDDWVYECSELLNASLGKLSRERDLTDYAAGLEAGAVSWDVAGLKEREGVASRFSADFSATGDIGDISMIGYWPTDLVGWLPAVEIYRQKFAVLDLRVAVDRKAALEQQWSWADEEVEPKPAHIEIGGVTRLLSVNNRWAHLWKSVSVGLAPTRQKPAWQPVFIVRPLLSLAPGPSDGPGDDVWHRRPSDILEVDGRYANGPSEWTALNIDDRAVSDQFPGLEKFVRGYSHGNKKSGAYLDEMNGAIFADDWLLDEWHSLARVELITPDTCSLFLLATRNASYDDSVEAVVDIYIDTPEDRDDRTGREGELLKYTPAPGRSAGEAVIRNLLGFEEGPARLDQLVDARVTEFKNFVAKSRHEQVSLYEQRKQRFLDQLHISNEDPDA